MSDSTDKVAKKIKAAKLTHLETETMLIGVLAGVEALRPGITNRTIKEFKSVGKKQAKRSTNE